MSTSFAHLFDLAKKQEIAATPGEVHDSEYTRCPSCARVTFIGKGTWGVNGSRLWITCYCRKMYPVRVEISRLLTSPPLDRERAEAVTV